MAQQIVQRYCPHCNKRISFEVNPGLRYGNAIRKCPLCDGSFVDTSMTELAFEDLSYYKKHVKNPVLTVIMTIIPFVVLGLAIANVIPPIPGLIIFFALSFVRMFYVGLYSFPKMTEEFEKMYEESANRLNDPEYIAILKQHDFKFPRKFIKSHPEFFTE